MPPANVSTHLEELVTRVEELERRLAALENLRAIPSPRPEPLGVRPTALSDSDESPSAPLASSLLSVFGKSILGIAGAYVLRAAAESRIFPTWMAVTLALAYAFGWMVWAAWPGAQTRLARYCYAITAALILFPMLWEVTVRFGILEPRMTAAVLAGFAVLAMSLAWRSNKSPIVWVGMLTSVIAALALMIGTRAPAPFTVALLFMALVTDFAGLRGRWRGLRPVVAMAVDLATLMLIVILGDSRAIPDAYHPVGAGVLISLVAALWAIYAVSLAIHSLIYHRKIKAFDVAQFVATALLAGLAVLRITGGAGRVPLGICCFIIGAACYVAAFNLLARHEERSNFHFYAACAVAFTMTGSFLGLPQLPLVTWLCFAAVIATGLGVRLRSPAFELHGVVYLAGALSASGLLVYAGQALAGTYPPAPGAMQIVAAAAAILCTALVSRYPGERSGERILRLLPAVLAVYATAGFAVSGLVWLTAKGGAPALTQLAVIRTLVTCAAALLLAFLGARWNRLELVWMAYAAAVLGSLKLVLEDLRFGSAQSLAVSLLIYGAVLILIPRLVRAEKRERL